MHASFLGRARKYMYGNLTSSSFRAICIYGPNVYTVPCNLHFRGSLSSRNFAPVSRVPLPRLRCRSRFCTAGSRGERGGGGEREWILIGDRIIARYLPGIRPLVSGFLSSRLFQASPCLFTLRTLVRKFPFAFSRFYCCENREVVARHTDGPETPRPAGGRLI